MADSSSIHREESFLLTALRIMQKLQQKLLRILLIYNVFKDGKALLVEMLGKSAFTGFLVD